jgi:hypothetical protein
VDLCGIGGAVRVEHDDHVTAGGLEAAHEGVPLATPGLLHDLDRWEHPESRFDGSVGRCAVHQDDLVDRRQLGEHDFEVAGLVERRNDDRDARTSDRSLGNVTHG